MFISCWFQSCKCCWTNNNNKNEISKWVIYTHGTLEKKMHGMIIVWLHLILYPLVRLPFIFVCYTSMMPSSVTNIYCRGVWILFLKKFSTNRYLRVISYWSVNHNCWMNSFCFFIWYTVHMCCFTFTVVENNSKFIHVHFWCFDSISNNDQYLKAWF